MFEEDAKAYFEQRDDYYGDLGKRCSWHMNGLCHREGAGRQLITNYFESLMRLYRAYWRVLLPYQVEIRPFAMCFTGKNYAENTINGNWAFCCCKKVKFVFYVASYCTR